MERCIIVAVAEDGAIGRKNALLWHLPEDLRYFRRVTTGHPVIMGYMTFRSIGRPLPGRLNIVTTWSPFDAPAGVVQVDGLEQGYAAAERSGADKAFVIGGGETYRQALPTADTLYITHVHATVPDADTFFPPIDPAVWAESSRSAPHTDPETGLTYDFAVYTRRKRPGGKA